MDIGKIILGLVPFALFGVLAGQFPVGWASLAAATAAGAIAALEGKGGVKMLPMAGVVILGALAIVGFTADALVQEFLATYGRGVSTLLLAVFVLATVPFAPFTARYARENVPEDRWHSPLFIRTNQRISSVWGLTILASGICHMIAAAVWLGFPDIRPIIPLAIDWGLPILAILATVRYTKAAAAAAAGGTAHRADTRDRIVDEA